MQRQLIWLRQRRSALINQGTIQAEGGAGKSLDVQLGNLSRNEGTITAAGGASLRVFANVNTTWTNFGTISATGGGTLQVGLQTTEAWSNVGTISVTGSTLKLDGAISQAQIGNLVRDVASTIILDALALYSGTLTLNNTTGSWVLTGATLQNGAINTSGSARLIALGGPSTLQSETINGTLDLTTGSTRASMSPAG